MVAILGPVIIASLALLGIFLQTDAGKRLLETIFPPPSVSLLFDFETGIENWRCEETASSVRGCAEVSRSDTQHHDGNFSLEVVLNLAPGNPSNAKAEVLVVPPEVDTTLQSETISAWVYMPQGAVGDPDHPNGLHLFVKDSDASWRGLYGCWVDASLGWQEVTLTITTDEPECANGSWYMSPGFDPTHIRAIGVAIGTPEQDYDQAFVYQGPIYIDQVELHR
ncbi:MAG: hypothetical protein IT320_20225 [Anaerolineae bacterium]|nr:hypothetical protein [Anaerolineae bacterium]